MKMIQLIQRQQSIVWIFLFYAVIAAALISPIASQTDIPSMADMINHLAEIIQAKTALAHGQFPLRIAPLWKYPVYQFYSPSTYLLAGLIYWFLTPHNPLIAYQLMTWLSLVLGGVYLARVAFWFTGVRIAALLAGVVYVAAPYNIIANFRIGDLNEGVALGVLPVVLFYTLNYFDRPLDYKSLLKMVLAYYLLITTHLVTAIYFTFFVGLFLCYLVVKNKRWQNLLNVGAGYVWGALLACWFLAPILFFEKYLYVSSTYHTTDYLMQFHPLLANLFSTVALITRGYTSAVATLHPAVGWPLLLGFAVSAYAYCQQPKSASPYLPALLFIFLLAFFCVWSPVNFWQWLPSVLRTAQYSWRLLGQVMWIGSILFAFAIAWIFNQKLDRRHALIGTFLILMSVSPWFISVNSFRVSLADFSKEPFLVYNNNAYLIDFERYPNFVSEVNTVQLNVTNAVNLNAPITIPYPLFKINPQPKIILQGEIEKISMQKLHWLAFLNQQKIAEGDIKAGPFVWQVPIPRLTEDAVTQDQLVKIKMVLQEKGKPIKWFQAPIKKVLLTGFVNPLTLMNLKQMQPFCHDQGAHILCDVNVPKHITTVELPAYFYPQLLDIRLNGQPIAYRGILDDNALLAGVTPLPGQHNRISIQFRGLPWANDMSLLALALWLFYGVYKWLRNTYN